MSHTFVWNALEQRMRGPQHDFIRLLEGICGALTTLLKETVAE